MPSFRIILEALRRSYSEPPLVSLRRHQYNFISVHIMVGLSDLLSKELSVVACASCWPYVPIEKNFEVLRIVTVHAVAYLVEALR